MAEIAPFRGLRYNLQKIPDLGQVVIPPYDVISPTEQEAFHRSSPFNMIHLELGRTTPEDSEENNAHTRAARCLREWQREEVLIREERPAIYYCELDYFLAPQVRQTRYGFMCVLRLEDFSSGRVRPHERTFQAVKDERLGLMLACHANLSPVFALYSDPALVVDYELKTAREPDPVSGFTDSKGLVHRIWRVLDPQVLQKVRALMMDKAIFIADGHHRYETALAYRSIQRERFPEAGPNASFEYIMVYLSNLNQGGLTILPTHRLLRRMGFWKPDRFLEQAQGFFEVSDHEANEEGRAEWKARLDDGRSSKETVIGFHRRSTERFYLLKARRDRISSYLSGRGMPDVLHGLDVVVLDQLILRHILELSEELLGNEHNIHFKHDLDEAIAAVQNGEYEAGFFINPTRIEQVQEVASAGLIMPHKSTYFYPKVGSGMVIHPLLETRNPESADGDRRFLV